MEYDLAKVGVAGSNPVSRSIKNRKSGFDRFPVFFYPTAARILCDLLDNRDNLG